MILVEPASRRATRKRAIAIRQRRLDRRGYILVSAAFLIIGALVLYPSAQSFIGSFFRYELGDPDHPFVGVDNYITVLTDDGFLTALENTLGYLIAISVLLFVSGMAIAVWLQRLRGKARAVAVTLVVLPWAVPGTISGSLWSLILMPTTSGLLNSVLISAGVIHDPVSWIQTPAGGTFFIGLMVVWSGAPFAAIILLAGLEGIPQELYEASTVDGATGVQRFFTITLPLLRPAMALVALSGALSAIGLYDQVFVLVGNDPARITLTGQVYLSAFQDFNFGFGYAASVIATLLSALFAWLYLTFIYREVEY